MGVLRPRAPSDPDPPNSIDPGRPASRPSRRAGWRDGYGANRVRVRVCGGHQGTYARARAIPAREASERRRLPASRPPVALARAATERRRAPGRRPPARPCLL